MTQVTIQPATFGAIVAAQNELITDGSKTNTGAMRRFALSLDFLTSNIGVTMDKKDLKTRMAEINARAYPKQDPKSHNMWAGKAVASMIRNGFAVEVI
jgi:hypothetical protein